MSNQLKFTTPDLCDQFADLVQVVEPLFNSYGGVAAFGGEIVTVKCFEDNSKENYAFRFHYFIVHAFII